MGTGVREPEDAPPDLANARIGYQQAVNLWIYEGNQVWAKFTALIYANTIVLATIGVVATGNGAARLVPFRVALAILGLVLSVSWIFLTKRSFDYYKYWIFSARELEERYLSPVQVVSRGGRFAEGREVKFNVSLPNNECATACTNKRPRIAAICYLIIAVFISLYLATLCLL
jgi:hypothetical protein